MAMEAKEREWISCIDTKKADLNRIPESNENSSEICICFPLTWWIMYKILYFNWTANSIICKTLHSFLIRSILANNNLCIFQYSWSNFTKIGKLFENVGHRLFYRHQMTIDSHPTFVHLTKLLKISSASIPNIWNYRLINVLFVSFAGKYTWRFHVI